jgi:hypothetical protein
MVSSSITLIFNDNKIINKLEAAVKKPVKVVTFTLWSYMLIFRPCTGHAWAGGERLDGAMPYLEFMMISARERSQKISNKLL